MSGGTHAPSRPRRGLASPVAIRRGEGAQRKRCRDPRCSPRGNPACRGTFGGREAKDSALLSSRDAGLLEPPERPQGCGARGGFLPRHDEDLREPLVRRQGSQVSMRVVHGILQARILAWIAIPFPRRSSTLVPLLPPLVLLCEAGLSTRPRLAGAGAAEAPPTRAREAGCPPSSWPRRLVWRPW